MKKKYFEITAELKTGKANFLIVCEKREIITETLVWYIVYNNITTDISKKIKYHSREISFIDYIKSQKNKLKTPSVTSYDDSVEHYLKSVLQRTLSPNNIVLPSALF